MSSDAKSRVNKIKKDLVGQLVDLMRQRTTMIASINGLPSAQFQEIKKKLRGKATIRMAKKNLIRHAFNKIANKELSKLTDYIGDSTIILFSNNDAFELSGVLGSEKASQKAKAGQVVPFDIEVKAGPTELIPGPDISALSAVGLIPKVEGGKISIMQDKVILKKDGIITDAIASIMAKLDIIPFEVGIDPVAAFMDEKVYGNIRIDVEKTVANLADCYGQAMAFDVELEIVNEVSLGPILNKAIAQETMLTRIITGEPVEEISLVDPVVETTKEELKEESKQESAVGLASLFG